MCGRYTHLFTWKQLHRLMRLSTPEAQLALRYNVAPTQFAPVVIAPDASTRALHMLRWGLIPWWSKDESIGARTINARAETVATAPAFRDAFKRRRAIIPISGFYEWQKLPGTPALRAGRRPWYFTPAGDEPLALAGLWEEWTGPDRQHQDNPVRTFTIITVPANSLVAPMHDRMPAILPPEHFDTWLDPKLEDAPALGALLQPAPPDTMKATPVSTRVNTPANDDAACIEESSVIPAPPSSRKRPAPDTPGLFG